LEGVNLLYMGLEIVSIGAVLAILTFLWGAMKWLIKHFDPHIIRMLDSIDNVGAAGKEMVQGNKEQVAAINRAIDVFETQQEWLERFDEVATERHKRIMERFDVLDNTATQVLFAQHECPVRRREEHDAS